MSQSDSVEMSTPFSRSKRLSSRLPFFNFHSQIYKLNHQIRPLVPRSDRIFDLDSLLWAEQVRLNLNWLLKRLEPESQGLDIGCGKGHVASLLSRLGYKMNGIDLPVTIGEPMWIEDPEWQSPIWDMLHKQDGPTFQFGDGRDLPYKDNSFDFVIAYAVIEHITPQSDIPTFLKEIRRVLKPGGLVLFADAPRKFSYTEKLAGKLGLGEHDNKYHEHEFVKIIGRELEIVDSGIYDMLPGHPPGKVIFRLYNLLFPLTKLMEIVLCNTPLKRFAHHNRAIARKPQ